MFTQMLLYLPIYRFTFIWSETIFNAHANNYVKYSSIALNPSQEPHLKCNEGRTMSTPNYESAIALPEVDVPFPSSYHSKQHFQSFLIPLQNHWTANHKPQKNLHLQMVLPYCGQVKSFLGKRQKLTLERYFKANSFTGSSSRSLKTHICCPSPLTRTGTARTGETELWHSECMAESKFPISWQKQPDKTTYSYCHLDLPNISI